VVFAWSIDGAFAVEDQYEVVRVVRGVAALHIAHFAARGRSIAGDEERATEWLRRLQDALVVHRASRPPVADAEPPAEREEVDRRLALLAEAPRPGEPADPAAFHESMLRGIGRGERPELYASVSTMVGFHLLRSRPAMTAEQRAEAEARFRHRGSPPELKEGVSYGVFRSSPTFPPEAVEVAIRAFRSAMEVLARQPDAGMWATTAMGLAQAFMHRQPGDPVLNLSFARHGYQQAAEVFGALGRRPALAHAITGLAMVNWRLAAAGEAQGVQVAVELYEMALRIQTPDGEPLDWAETMLNLAGAQEELGRATGRAEQLIAAETAYASVLEQAASNAAFKGLDVDSLAWITGYAIQGLQRLDRTGTPEPRTPSGFRDRDVSGRVVYLRPLLSSGTLVLANRFRDPSTFAVQFDVEPGTLTLESALYRVLAEHVSFSTVGGRAEGFGATRWYIIGGEGWEESVKLNLSTADLVLMFPHDSPGVRWEVGHITDTGALGKVLFVMPPASPGMDVPAVWQGAVEMMRAFGLELPVYRDEGLFFRLGADGTVAETLPFDCVWDNTLYAGIAHLLPGSKGGVGFRREAGAADSASRPPGEETFFSG
jgi:hypothetical protein